MSRGYEPDFKKAAEILRLISTKKPEAAARLGRLYMDGRGVGGKDYNLAYKYLKQVCYYFISIGNESFLRQKRKKIQWE